MEMLVLRNTQGLHAPMKLAMEIKAAEKVGRLPFLPSSNIMRDVLLGYDEDLGYLVHLLTTFFNNSLIPNNFFTDSKIFLVLPNSGSKWDNLMQS